MVHSNYLGDDPTKERNMKEGKKKRRNEERQEGPYKGAEGTRELVVALVSERKQTNKPRKAQTVTVTSLHFLASPLFTTIGPLLYCL